MEPTGGSRNGRRGVVPPGESMTIMIDVPEGAKFLSATGMLATSNDAFFGVTKVALPHDGMEMVNAVIYDAGSEANNEACTHIPGPPCAEDSGNARMEDGAEGMVQVHAGIMGTMDIMKDAAWMEGAVTITISHVGMSETN